MGCVHATPPPQHTIRSFFFNHRYWHHQVARRPSCQRDVRAACRSAGGAGDASGRHSVCGRLLRPVSAGAAAGRLAAPYARQGAHSPAAQAPALVPLGASHQQITHGCDCWQEAWYKRIFAHEFVPARVVYLVVADDPNLAETFMARHRGLGIKYFIMRENAVVRPALLVLKGVMQRRRQWPS